MCTWYLHVCHISNIVPHTHTWVKMLLTAYACDSIWWQEAHRPLKKSDEDALRNMGIDEKWKTIIQEVRIPHCLVNNDWTLFYLLSAPPQQGRAPIFSAKHYIDALKEHSDGTKKSRPSFWKSQGRPGGTGTLGGVLTKLKLDLKMSHERSVDADFVLSHSSAHMALSGAGLWKILWTPQTMELTNWHCWLRTLVKTLWTWATVEINRSCLLKPWSVPSLEFHSSLF